MLDCIYVRPLVCYHVKQLTRQAVTYICKREEDVTWGSVRRFRSTNTLRFSIPPIPHALLNTPYSQRSILRIKQDIDPSTVCYAGDRDHALVLGRCMYHQKLWQRKSLELRDIARSLCSTLYPQCCIFDEFGKLKPSKSQKEKSIEFRKYWVSKFSHCVWFFLVLGLDGGKDVYELFCLYVGFSVSHDRTPENFVFGVDKCAETSHSVTFVLWAKFIKTLSKLAL